MKLGSSQELLLIGLDPFKCLVTLCIHWSRTSAYKGSLWQLARRHWSPKFTKESCIWAELSWSCMLTHRPYQRYLIRIGELGPECFPLDSCHSTCYTMHLTHGPRKHILSQVWHHQGRDWPYIFLATHMQACLYIVCVTQHVLNIMFVFSSRSYGTAQRIG